MKNLYVILSLACLISCERDTSSDCFQGYGTLTEESRALPVFTELEVHDIFNIYLLQDTINELTIKTGDQLLDEIEVTLSGKKLHIYNHSECRWLRKYVRPELYLRFRDMDWLKIWEPCRVVTLKPVTKPYFRIYSFAKIFEGDIELNNQYFQHGVNYTCGGSTRISGHTGHIKLMNRGVHHIIADSLVSSFAEITNNSRGDIWAGTCDTLAVSIWLSGNVFYRGNPAIISSEIISSGQLIRLDK